jgi:hypothetical protein
MGRAKRMTMNKAAGWFDFAMSISRVSGRKREIA